MLIIITVSILANHLFEPKNFPTNKDYQFPLLSICVSTMASVVIILISLFNFIQFKHRYFTKKINAKLLLRFLFSTLGYITLLYLILYYSLNGLINGIESYSIYHLLTGLTLSLLICTVGIVLLFSVDIYNLYKNIATKGTLKVQQSGKITLVKYIEIALFYSENKIVYVLKTDGTTITTGFTLNEIESKISEQSFFRVNRQNILNVRSIEQIQSIDNGKLSVILKPTISYKKACHITISRYKKQEFMNWFKHKL